MLILNRKLSMENRRQGGFTLMEMILVIVILSMVTILVLPRLPSTEGAELRTSARSLAAAIRYLGDLSITAKAPHRLHFNLTEGTIAITRKNADGEDVPPEDVFLGRQFLAEGVTLEDVEIQRLGKISSGEVVVDFGVGGLEEYVSIHLQGKGGGHFTVDAFPQSGKVKVYEEYREAAQ
jgi:general secretion pathway protein H